MSLQNKSRICRLKYLILVLAVWLYLAQSPVVATLVAAAADAREDGDAHDQQQKYRRHNVYVIAVGFHESGHDAANARIR